MILAAGRHRYQEIKLNTRGILTLLILLSGIALGCQKTDYNDLIAAKKERDKARRNSNQPADAPVVRKSLIKEIESAGGFVVLSKSDSSVTKVDFTDINNELLAKLADCTRLKSLSFNGSTLDAKSFETIASFGNLERLDISGAKLSSESIVELSKLPNLKFLQMSRVGFPTDGFELLSRFPLWNRFVVRRRKSNQQTLAN